MGTRLSRNPSPAAPAAAAEAAERVPAGAPAHGIHEFGPYALPVFWLCFVFCVLCVLALSGGVCVLCFVFWPLLEELYLVENVTHCVFALKARRRRQFLEERWTQHIDLAELHFF